MDNMNDMIVADEVKATSIWRRGQQSMMTLMQVDTQPQPSPTVPYQDQGTHPLWCIHMLYDASLK